MFVISVNSNHSQLHLHSQFAICVSSQQNFSLKYQTLELGQTSDLFVWNLEVKTEDGSGHSALIAATQTGHVRLVETLLSAGAETYLRMADGLTPLGHVIKHKQTELVKLFLKHGAECCIYREDPQTSNCGELCLELAVGSRNSDIIVLITKHIGNSRKFQDEL